jgi:hypothetical protein
MNGKTHNVGTPIVDFLKKSFAPMPFGVQVIRVGNVKSSEYHRFPLFGNEFVSLHFNFFEGVLGNSRTEKDAKSDKQQVPS